LTGLPQASSCTSTSHRNQQTTVNLVQDMRSLI
jgi:hypothetical protein